MPAREYYPPFLSIITTVCQSAALTGLFMKSGLVSRLIVTFSSFYHIFFPIMSITNKNKTAQSVAPQWFDNKIINDQLANRHDNCHNQRAAETIQLKRRTHDCRGQKQQQSIDHEDKES